MVTSSGKHLASGMDGNGYRVQLEKEQTFSPKPVSLGKLQTTDHRQHKKFKLQFHCRIWERKFFKKHKLIRIAQPWKYRAPFWWLPKIQGRLEYMLTSLNSNNIPSPFLSYNYLKQLDWESYVEWWSFGQESPCFVVLQTI